MDPTKPVDHRRCRRRRRRFSSVTRRDRVGSDALQINTGDTYRREPRIPDDTETIQISPSRTFRVSYSIYSRLTKGFPLARSNWQPDVFSNLFRDPCRIDSSGAFHYLERSFAGLANKRRRTSRAEGSERNFVPFLCVRHTETLFTRASFPRYRERGATLIITRLTRRLLERKAQKRRGGKKQAEN